MSHLLKIYGCFFVLLFTHLPEISAQQLADSLKRELKTASHEHKIDLLNELAREYEESDFELAMQYSQEALTLAKESGYEKGEVKSLLNLGYLQQLKGNTDAGIDFIQQSIAAEKRASDNELLSECYYRLGGLYFTRGELDSADFYAAYSREYALKNQSEQMLNMSNHLFALIYGTQGKYESALHYFFELFDYFTRTDNKPNIAMHLKNIGHTYILLGKYDEALEHLWKALELQRQLNNKNAICWILTNLGSCYTNKGNDTKALPYYEEALVLAKEIGNPLLVIVSLNGMGQIFSRQGNNVTAENYLLQALQKCREYGKNSHYIYVLGSLATFYHQTGDFNQAIRFGKKHLEMAEKEKNLREIISGNHILAKTYAAIGDYQSAYNYQNRIMDAKDSLILAEKMKLSEELTTRYETKLKEQQIEVLNARNLIMKNRKNIFAVLFIIVFLAGSFIIYIKLRQVKANRLSLQKEKELGKLKSRFFANITHEFRTPLTMMFGPLEQLKSEITDKSQLHLLDLIQANSKRVLKLINQLLEISKIESGTVPVKVSEQNIIVIIDGLANLFESLAEENQVEMRIIHHKSLVNLYFDAEKIEKVFINLMYNAFKFNEKYGVVTVETDVITEGQQDWFVCRVSNTGHGIAKEDLPFIFDRFFQSESNHEKLSAGTGIGLALCRELVLLHHGTINAESLPGRETTFTFKLPLGAGHFTQEQIAPKMLTAIKSKAQQMLFPNEKAAPERKTQPSKRKPVLLLIEDNSTLRKYMVEMLRNEYALLEAKNGEEGISQACRHIPDLIISDVVMPEKDGFEVCRELKNNELTSHIPVILLTGKVGVNHRLAGLETKADAYLTKPFIQKELLLRIENLIESREKLLKKYRDIAFSKSYMPETDSVDEQFLQKIVKVVEDNLGNEHFSVEHLGKAVGISRSQLHRKLKALLGKSPNEFIRSFRLNRALDLLQKNAATASEVAYDVGFASPSYFTHCFHKQFGYLPSEAILKKNI